MTQLLHRLQATLRDFTETAQAYFRARTETGSTQMVVEELEPRILHSADFSPAVVSGDAFTAFVENRELEAQAVPAAPAPTAQTEQAHALELVFVDTSVPDYQILLDDIATRTGDHRLEVVLLDSDRDGIQKITETLAAHSDVSAIHIISHGSDGEVNLGQAVLDASFIAHNGDQLSGWSTSLTDDADILIYGCDVAQSDLGRDLLQQLSTLTGADVAGSDDLTGAAALGGDWILEYQFGAIEAQNALTQQAQREWSGLLDSVAASGEIQVNTTLAGKQTEANVAMDSNGNFVAVWTADGNLDGNGRGIFAQRFDASGSKLGTEVLVNTAFANDQTQAAVAMDPSGNYVVVWTSDKQDGDKHGIYAQRFNAAGVAQGGEFRVNGTTTNEQNDPAVAMDASGNFTVVWTSKQNGNLDVFARQYSAAGAPLAAEIRVNSTPGGDQQDADVAMDSSGNFVVVWTAGNNLDGGGKGIFGQRFSAGGSKLGGEVRVNTTTVNDQSQAAVAMGASGNYVVAWASDKQDGSNNGIYAQRFDAAGVAQGGEFRVNTTIAKDQVSPSIAIDATDGFTVAWQSNNQDGSNTGIYAQSYDAAGFTIGSEFQVNVTTSGAQSLPSIAMRGNGDFAVVWEGESANDNVGIVARTYSSLNQAPVNVVPGAQVAGGGAHVFSTAVGNAIQISDVDAGGAIERVTLTATNGTLTLSQTTGLGFGAGDGTADATMTFDGTLAAINAALDGMSFTATANFSGAASVQIISNDLGFSGAGGSLTDTDIVNITVVSAGTPFILSGSYTGDALDNRAITGLGFTPDVVILKARDSGEIGVIRTSTMAGDLTKELTSGSALVANEIQSLDSDGFTIGSDDTVNEEDENYDWIAFKTSPGFLTVGTYTGDGTVGRTVTGLGFSPDALFVFDAGNEKAVFTNSAAAGNAFDFDNSTDPSWITSLGADGFTVGSDQRVNGTGRTYHYVAWNEVPGLMDVGSYTGDDVDNRNIGGVGFQPEWVVVNNISGDKVMQHFDSQGAATDSSSYFTGSGADTDRIQQLQADGFQIGTDGTVNKSGETFTYMAFKQETAPTISNVPDQSTDEDTSTVAIAFTVGDGETAAGSLVVAASSSNQGVVPDANIVIGGSGSARTVSVTPAPDQYGTVTITLRVSDGFAVATDTFVLTINPINDAPTVSAPAEIGVNEDVASALAGIAFADPDAGAGSLQATFTVPQGTLAALPGAGVTVGGTATNLTLTGTLADINAFIAAGMLDYTTAPNDVSSVTLGVSIDDLGNFGAGGPLSSAISNVTLNVTAINDAASVNLDTGAGGVDYALTFTEGDAPTAIVDATVSVADLDDTTLVNVTLDAGGIVDGASEQLTIGDLSFALNAADFTNATVNIGGNPYTVTWVNATGIATITLNSGEMSIAQSQAVMLASAYQHTDTSDPTGGNRTIGVRVNDGDSDSAVATTTITVVPVNDEPTLTTFGNNPGVVGAGPPVLIFSGTSVSTVESGQTLTGLTIAVSNVIPPGSGDEKLTIDGTTITVTTGAPDGTTTNFSYSVSKSGNDFTIVFSGGSVTSSVLESIVDSATYQHLNPSPNGSDRTIEITQLVDSGGIANGGDNTNDLTGQTSISTMVVATNPPVITGAGGTLAYTEGDGPQVIDTSLMITDADDTDLQSATLIISGYVNSEDVLAFADTVNIAGNWVAATGVLTLTGPDTLANYEAALWSITYTNSNTDNPNTNDRTITWLVNDGISNSAPVQSTITVAGVNSAPTVDLDTATGGVDYAFTFTEGDSATAIVDATVIVADIDDTTLVNVTLDTGGIVDGAAEQLTIGDLSFALNAADFTNATVTIGSDAYTVKWTNATGIAIITLNSGEMSIAQSQAVMLASAYQHTDINSPTVGNRTIDVRVHDGDTDSAVATSTITVAAVNTAPTVDLDTGTGGVDYAFTFTEGDGATAIVHSSVIVADSDDTTLVNVTLDSGGIVDGAAEQLTIGDLTFALNTADFTNIAVTIGGNPYTVNWVNATGIATITLNSGEMSIAQSQAVMVATAYQHTDTSNPTGGNRTIEVRVNDGDTDSAVATTTITVAPTNDAPTLLAPGAIGVTEDVAIALAGISFSDVDAAGASVVATFTVAQGTLAATPSGGVTVGGTPTALTLTGSTANLDAFIAASNLTYTTVLNDISPVNLGVSLNDQGNTGSGGALSSGVTNVTLNVTPVNDASTVDLDTGTGGVDYAFTFTEGDPATAIVDATVAVTDVDDTTLVSVTLATGGIIDAAAEQLTIGDLTFALNAADFTNATVNIGGNPYTVNWVNATGIATITLNSGEMSIAQSQAVMLATQYQHTDTNNPTVGDRTIGVRVNDGNTDSAVATSTITVAPVNNAPTLDLDTGSGGVDYAFTFTEGDPATGIVDATVIVADSDDTSLVNVTLDTGGIVDGSAEQLTIGDLTFALNAADFTNATVNIGGNPYTVNWVNATGIATITLNSGEMSIAQSQAVMLASAYQHTDTVNPTGANRTIDVRVNDGDTDSAVATSTITVAAVNSAPTVDLDTGTGGIDYVFTFTEGDPATAIVDATVNVADSDDTTLVNVTLDAGGIVDGAAEQLTIGDLTFALNAADFTNATVNIGGNPYTVNWVNATGIVTITLNSGEMSIAQSQAVMLATQYQHTDTVSPTAGNRTIDVRVHDGDTDSAVATSTITVASVNDAPINGIPGPQVTNEDTRLVFSTGNGNLISIADVDAGNNQVRVTLDVSMGTLTLNKWVGAESQANTFTSNNQEHTEIAMDDAGNYVVVWQSTDQDMIGGRGIYAQRYDSKGATQGTEFLVNTTTIIGEQKDPMVAMDALGNFVVVWESGASGAQDIFAQRFDNVGIGSGEFAVNTATIGQQKNAAVAMDALGNFVVAWESDAAGNQDIFAQRFDNKGIGSGEFAVNVTTTGDQKHAAVATDDLGNFVVAWESDAAGNFDIFAQGFDSKGGKGEFAVNTSTAGDQKRAVVAMDADGDFVVAWESPDADKKGIFAQRFDFNAPVLKQGSEFQVNTTTTGDQSRPSVAMDADGDFIVAWEGPDANNKGIFAQRFYADGTTQGGEIAVNSATTFGAQSRPGVAMDADGNYALAWETPDASGKGVHQARSSYFNFTSGDGTDDANMVFTGTVAEINLALDGLTFVPTPDYTGPASITITVDDLGNTGGGGAMSDSDVVNITVNGVNDAPSLNAPGAIGVTEDVASALTGISFSDVDAGGANVVVTFTVAQGTLAAAPSGGVTVGGSPTALTLTGSTASLDAFIAASNLTYTTALNDTSAVTLGVSVNDQGNTGSGGALSSGVTNVTLNVTPVNNASTVDLDTGTGGVDYAFTFTEGDPATAIVDATVAVADVDDTTLVNVTLDSGGIVDGAAEQLTIGNLSFALNAANFTNAAVTIGGNAYTVNWVTASGIATITLNSGEMSIAQSQAVMLATQYQHTGTDNPTAGNRTFDVRVNDGDNDSAVATSTITVAAVNDAPVHSVPGAQITVTNTAVIFSTANGNAMSVTDVDAGIVPVQMSLSTPDGTLTLNGTTGLSFSTGSGTGDASMTFSGTIADVNAALDGLRFDPTAAFSGSTSVSVTTNDLGSSGAGGAQSASDLVIVNVSFTNAAPVLAGANDLSPINEDAATNSGTSVLTLIAGNITDADAGSLSGIAVIGVDNTNGTWQYSTNSGASWMTFGSPSANAARLLAENGNTFVRFAPNPDWNGSVANGLTFRAWDQTSGSTGGTADTTATNNGGTTAFSVATASSSITVNAVNDGPGLTAPGAIGVTEDVATALTGISFSDVDAAGTSVVATFTVAQGTLAATSGGGVSVAGTPTALTLTGSTASIDAFIAASNLTYTTAPDDTSPVTLGVSINDQGNTGSGGALSSGVTNVTLNVSAVNDAPSLNAPGAIGVIEDAANALTGISFSDIDAAGASVVATFTVAQGTLAATPSGGVIVGGTPTALTLTGSTASINAFIAASNLTYTTALNDTSAVTLGVSVNDQGNTGGGALSSGVTNVTLNVSAVNDAPSLTAPGAIGVTEDVASALTGISFSDVDAAGTSVVATFTVAQGTLAATTGGGVTVGGTPTALTLTGSTASIDAFIAASNLTYTTAPDDTSPVTLGVSVNDQGNTGSGGALSSGVSNVTLNVTPVDDAPTGAVNIIGTPTEDQVLTASNTLADADGLGAISYQWQRNGVNIVGATANTYTLGDVDVGTTISLVASYTDGFGTPESVSSAGVGPIVNVNDAPLGIPTITGTVTEDQVLSVDTSGISDTDGLGAFSYQWLRNGGAISGATASTYTLGDADVGTLISVQASYTDAYATAEGPLASVQTAAVSGINDAPAISTLPPAQAVVEGAVLSFSTTNGNAIAISDVDAGAAIVELSLSATNGTLTLASIAGLGFSSGDGSADATMQFTGSLANINNALNGLQFTSNSGFAGNATVSASINDLGNTGAGGPLLQAGAVNISVTAATIPIVPVTPPPPVVPPVVPPTPTPDPDPDTDPPAPEEAGAPAVVAPAVISSGGNATPLTSVLADDSTRDAPALRAVHIPDSQPNRSIRIVAAGSGFDVGYFGLTGGDLASGNLNFVVAPITAFPSFDSGHRALNAPEFVEELDRMREILEQQAQSAGVLVTSGTAATVGLSVGYLFWLLRAEVLLGSLLSSMPAWRMVDPLPVLGRLASEDDEDGDEDDDSIESMVERNNRGAQDETVEDIEAI